MKQDRPSLTAERVAMRRAVHQILDHPKVLDDPIAVKIAGGPVESDVRSEPGKFNSAEALALRAFLVARSRCAEDRLSEAIQRGIGQYVILGAGLDTFAYRNPYPASRLRVFEVDHPATQAWKRQRLEQVSLSLPPSLTFVPVDFETEKLGISLLKSGFKAEEPSFFSWLGVTMYLATEAVIDTINNIASLTVPGSGLVFDYLISPSRLSPRELLGYQALAARVALVGEPWRSAFDPSQLAREAEAMGFTVVEDLDQDTLNERYFNNRSDLLRVSGRGRILNLQRVPSSLKSE